ncbi:MAG: ATP-dependent RecD-like DNA helicase [Chloroflexi bacterium]|nr:ATP-dependent RecD-like DNA helicase [Chloroflexota bacterium]
METITGSVERITFHNSENGYTVLRLRPDKRGLSGANREGLVTVIGNLPDISPGESLRLSGAWSKHPKHGHQFKAEQCEQVLPTTTEGLRRYLGSGLLPGIGPHLADRIVDKFGSDTLDVIENHPERLRQVQDIGPKRSQQIVRAWAKQKHVKDIMLFLHSHGISANLAVKIYKQYGDESLAIVQSNPYQLSSDIFGVGFKTADKIAQALGLPIDRPTRLEAGIMYLLEETNRNGHVYFPNEDLIKQAAELLNVESPSVISSLNALTESEFIVEDNLPSQQPSTEAQPVTYLAPYYFAELGLAARLKTLAAASPSRLSDLPKSSISIDQGLSPEQANAISTTLSQPVSVLTGGPGTGKTTAVKALIAALEAADKRYALASPTGRAAKRLSEAADRPASTIHRLLGYSPRDGFLFNANNPLQIDMLVVDEASMLDTLLAHNLLKALEPGTHLLLVGDVDQLPSVGAGDVLRDIIASQVVPVTSLSVIFRQAADSQIISNAHLINQGEQPDFPKDSRDFFLFTAESPEQAADWVEDVVTKRIPSRFGLDPLKDIQVLVPMYRGPAGINAINARLQAALNPPTALTPERTLSGHTFRPGDKVMQLKNDYEKKVFNGDIGFLADISQLDQTLSVKFDDRSVTYEWSEADQLTLAYAISVHKSQGSEFPAIVLPLLTQHYLMLQRNLLYTAVTRAKQLCVLISNRKTLTIALKNNQVAERYSGLKWRLMTE